MLLTARLRVVSERKMRFFDSPQDVWDWLETSGLATLTPAQVKDTAQARNEKDYLMGQRRQPRGYLKPKAVPDLEQRLNERWHALQAATQLRNTTPDLSPETTSGNNSSDEGSSAIWPPGTGH
ncbi:hypothetical protein NDU88_005081 [Pleurodeles waltl]|uniref:Uncharacterized protein n=1 Tax=Pleurodeles waltl TaxID=8319 RepID=A0AAV7UGZ6_PLEWA|nr:hypothetical protein NDU88_005081 [Pleurodeles waltl]